MYGLGAGRLVPRYQPVLPLSAVPSKPDGSGSTTITPIRLMPPFGGYKQSGIGRETHKMMLDHYQQTKNMLVSYNPNKLGFF